MDPLLELVKTFGGMGVLGGIFLLVAIGYAGMLAMGFFYHRSTTNDLKARIEEHREDKVVLLTTVANNTGAMEKTASAVDNCTDAIKQNNTLIQSLLQRGVK